MRAVWHTIIILAAALGASPALASTMAFEDNKLNYKSCDGISITARWRGSEFSLAEPGKSLGDAHKTIEHLGWDGTCKTTSWDSNGAKFAVAVDGSPTLASFVRYVAPDGSKWAGMRAGDGFFVTRMAAAGEDISDARVQEIADWLARTSKEFTPGAELAEHLKSAPSN